MSQSRKDQQAEAAVKKAILGLFGPETIANVEVHPGKDHTDEPALFTTVFLKAAQKRMSGTQLLDAIAAASNELRELDDNRFPYITFFAPDAEQAEDTRPAA